MRVALLAVLAGCTAAHSPPPPEPDAAPHPPATALFVPLLCTSGTPGDTSGCTGTGACCPFNTIDFSGPPFNAVKASFRFVAQALTMSDLYFNALELDAGDSGLYVENLRLTSECALTPTQGATIDLAPHATASLPTETLVGVSDQQVCVVMDVIGPYRP
jgi:hypothetical protein